MNPQTDSTSDLPPTGGPGTLPPPPLKLRVAQSRTIVTGRIVSIDPEVIVIDVDTVLRGNVEPGSKMRVNGRTPASSGILHVGDAGVWMVSSLGDPPGLLGGGPLDVTLEEVRAKMNE